MISDRSSARSMRVIITTCREQHVLCRNSRNQPEMGERLFIDSRPSDATRAVACAPSAPIYVDTPVCSTRAKTVEVERTNERITTDYRMAGKSRS